MKMCCSCFSHTDKTPVPLESGSSGARWLFQPGSSERLHCGWLACLTWSWALCIVWDLKEEKPVRRWRWRVLGNTKQNKRDNNEWDECKSINQFGWTRHDIRTPVNSPVYSAMEVMDEAVEPLSQSLSAARLLLRLPGNDSTESQLDEIMERGTRWIITRYYKSIF